MSKPSGTNRLALWIGLGGGVIAALALWTLLVPRPPSELPPPSVARSPLDASQTSDVAKVRPRFDGPARATAEVAPNPDGGAAEVHAPVATGMTAPPAVARELDTANAAITEAVRACAQGRWARSTGKLRVRFMTVSGTKSGLVSRSEVLESSVPEPVQGCILDRLRAARWKPSLRDRELLVERTFVLDELR